MEPFSVEQTETPGELRLIGELDIAGVQVLADAVSRVSTNGMGLRFDLTRLTFIDSSGISELLRAVRQRPGEPIHLLSPSPSILRILDIAGVRSAFHIGDELTKESSPG